MPGKIKKGLGAGLDVLFREDYLTEDQPTSVSITKLEPRQDQPREIFDEEALQALAGSIEQYGILQPITVRETESGDYQIIAGERRWRAAKIAGLTEVPVNIIEADDKKASEIALVENLQRENLNPLEEARGYRTLIDIYSLTQEEVSKSIGKSRPTVTNALRLLLLGEEVLKLVEDGSLSAGHARALIPITDPTIQFQTAKEIVEKGLSVRKTEQLVSKILKSSAKPKMEETDPYAIDYSREVSESLTKLMGRKVTLNEGRKTGKIVIEYYDADDREKLIELLSGLSK